MERLTVSTKKTLLVDGYNLLGKLKSIKFTNLEDARFYLINMLSDYSNLTASKIVLVFDGAEVTEQTQTIDNNLTVIFSSKNKSADNVIEKYATQITTNLDVIIVTADSIQQSLAFGRGVLRLTPEEFIDEYNSLKLLALDNHSDSQKSKIFVRDILPDSVKRKLDNLKEI